MRKKRPVKSFQNRCAEPVHTELDTSWQFAEAIANLPQRMRECFVLFAVEDRKQAEIAELLGLSEGTVKAHVFQAKEKLRKLFK
jgi:RNA polymerase sigma-70 factor (ECF subfamily)